MSDQQERSQLVPSWWAIFVPLWAWKRLKVLSHGGLYWVLQRPPYPISGDRFTFESIFFSRWSFVSPSSGPGVISTTSFLLPLGQDLKQPHTVFLLLTLIHRTAMTFQTTVLQTSTGCLNISGMNHVSIHLSTKLLGTNPLTWDYKFYRTISLETINVW